MTTQQSFTKTVLLVGTLLATFFLGITIVPVYAHAQGNMAAGANASCIPVIPPCLCNTILDPKTGTCIGGANKFMCPCQNTTSGQTSAGKCVSTGICKTETSSGKGVDSMLSQLGKMLGDALKGLGGGGGGGGSGSGSGSGQQQGTGTGTTACTSYYQVSTPSSDPCAYYVPSISDTLGNTTGNSTANDLLNALGGGSGNIGNAPSNTGTTGNPTTGGNTTGATDGTTGGTTNHDGTTGNAQAANVISQNSLAGLLSNAENLNLASSTEDNNGGSTIGSSFFSSGKNATTSAGADFASFATFTALVPGPNPNQTTGPQGDVKLGGNGATVSASNRDLQNNTVVAGFFGANTLGGVGPQGIAAWLCHKRPWANTIFSRIIPDSFFDGLCSWRGYPVGPSTQTSAAPVLTQTSVRANKPVTGVQAAASTTPTVQPRVQIWAVPASVSVGSRTSVFWSTQGVTSCTETSPDGSFSQASLSGGASTVPLTAPTTYSISCLTPDGTPVTAYFTVRMSI